MSAPPNPSSQEKKISIVSEVDAPARGGGAGELHASAPGSSDWKREVSGILRSRIGLLTVAVLAGAIVLRVGVNWYLHRSFQGAAPTVRVVEPTVRPIEQTLELPGNIEAIEQASLYSHVSGYLKKLYVDEGDHVKKGQLLAEIDAPDAVQEYEKAKAEFTLKDVTRKRYVELIKEQVVSQQEYDTVDAEANESKARFDNAAATLSYTKIRAPFEGSIARRFKYPGDLISTATGRGENMSPIFVLVNENLLRVATNVPQIDASSVVVGHSASVRVDTLPNRDFKGQISRIDALLDEATKTQRVLIDLDNPEGVLHAGMFATVRLQLSHKDHALMVPHEAIVQEGDQPSVYLVRKGRLKRTPVKVGYRETSAVEITEGVAPTDELAIPGGLILADGMAVTELKEPAAPSVSPPAPPPHPGQAQGD